MKTHDGSQSQNWLYALGSGFNVGKIVAACEKLILKGERYTRMWLRAFGVQPSLRFTARREAAGRWDTMKTNMAIILVAHPSEVHECLSQRLTWDSE
jgi:hypothetical protein